MDRVVRMAGQDVELSSDDDRRWAAIEALFGGCEASAGSPQIRLRFGERPPPLPATTPDVAYTGLEVWFDTSGAACRSATGVAARRTADVIDVGGPPEDAAPLTASELATAFRRSVQHVLADAMAEHGRHTLHAAAVAGAAEGVVIAVGGTGAGKSTLAYAASQRGWSVLGDDLAFVTLEHERLVASGLPKPLNVPRELLSTGTDVGSPIGDDPRGRVRVPIDGTGSDTVRPISAVVLLEHAEAAGRLEPMTPGPGLFKLLLASFPLAHDPRRLRQLFPVAAALSRLPTWTLHHDADPHRRVAAAAAMLDEIASAIAAA